MRLIYEWNTKRSKLEFAIKECEFQLANARKRLDELENDFKFYIVHGSVLSGRMRK